MKSEKQLLAILRPYSDPEKIEVDKSYFNSNHRYLGITVTRLRKLLEQTEFEDASLSELDKLFRQTNVFEIRTLILLTIQKRKKELDLSDWKILRGWSKLVDNWEHGDRLADLYACLLEQYPDKIFPVLQKWNKASYSWRRRLSIVSLFYYSRMRERYVPYEQALPLVASLLYDKDIYVQKAVGWTIRELYNVYPERTYDQLREWADKLAAAAWQAATEKLSTSQKTHLKSLRNKTA